MASVQCHKPAEKSSCHEGHSNSFSEKVSEMASTVFKGHGSHQSHGKTTECYSQTEVYYTDHDMAKTETRHCSSQTQVHQPSLTNGHHGRHHPSGNDMACQQGKTKRRGERKKRGLIQKIKDGISGDSSDSSSSDSESDNEGCGAKKN